MISPDIRRVLELESAKKRDKSIGRNLIVNMNQNNKRKIKRRTRLSDKDSIESGYITKKKGDRLLNNSLKFTSKKGNKGSGKKSSSQKNSKDNSLIITENSDVEISIVKPSGDTGENGDGHKLQIPDKDNVTRDNSIFYSSSGTFSFNTVKFKHYKYFNNVKNKISSNWYPPIMANATFGGYAPGRTRIMAIASQQVKLYFIMDKTGKIIETKILDSNGNVQLDNACLDAIRNSKSFGKVPKDLLKGGDSVVIPFIFGYYIR